MFGWKSKADKDEAREQEFRDRLADKLKTWEAKRCYDDTQPSDVSEDHVALDFDEDGIDADPNWLPNLSSTGSYLIHEADNPDDLNEDERRAYDRLCQSHTQWKIEQEDNLTESDLTVGTAYDLHRAHRDKTITRLKG